MNFSIFTCPTAAMSSAEMVTRGMVLVLDVPGVTVAITPIARNVVWPSSVHMLRSTVSATYWMKLSGLRFGISIP